tara:strand:+ start:95 stop:670 length:576 start_codon:yes stop_codon:yes gene_type:complete
MGKTYDSEKEVAESISNDLKNEIFLFIRNWQKSRAWLMTRRKDSREIMRPVGSFIDKDWSVGTITQDLHLKTKHIANDAITGYLWVEVDRQRYGRMDFPRNIWMQGQAELIHDEEKVQDFFIQRSAATGRGDAHPADDTYKRILIKTRPQYLRAEGFYKDEPMRAIIIRDFNQPITLSDESIISQLNDFAE